MEQSHVGNPANDRTAGQRGRVKQSRARNVALRCQRYKREMLRLLDDDRLPFDDNLAVLYVSRGAVLQVHSEWEPDELNQLDMMYLTAFEPTALPVVGMPCFTLAHVLVADKSGEERLGAVKVRKLRGAAL